MNGPILSWMKQLGTPAGDHAQGIATDNQGHVYICGETSGALEAGNQKGSEDGFLAKYTLKGERVWLKQIGTAEDDGAQAIATDAQGNVFVCGFTFGEMGKPSPGENRDLIIGKFSPEGEQLWLKQFGNEGNEKGRSITTDSEGNVVICGFYEIELEVASPPVFTRNSYWAKFSTDGRLLRSKLFRNTFNNQAQAVATDNLGNIFICGNTSGELEPGTYQGSTDAFVAKYTPNGREVWLRQISTVGDDRADGIATDARGNVFICGLTTGNLNTGGQKGGHDAFLAKFSTDGEEIWLHQVGSVTDDEAQGIATDALGNVFITGNTDADLVTGKHMGDTDSFIAKYSPIGEQVWIKQIGSTKSDIVRAITTDAERNIFIAGGTKGELEAGQTQGEHDIFLARYTDLDEVSVSHHHLLMENRMQRFEEKQEAKLTAIMDTLEDLQRSQSAISQDLISMNEPALAWLRQVGTDSSDQALTIAADSHGNVYFAGYTEGAFEPGQQIGNADAFLAKYSPYGEEIWVKQLGTPESDRIYSVSIDSAGDVLICGSTTGEMEVGRKEGAMDTFIAKYSDAGEQIWLKQLGSKEVDVAKSITSDIQGNIYVVGYSEWKGGNHQGGMDVILMRFTPEGRLVWGTQLGSPMTDVGKSIVADDQGNVYITGYTAGEIAPGQKQGNVDGFIAKYDKDGNQIWLKQIGSAELDQAFGMAIDSMANIYVTGRTLGEMVAGEQKGEIDSFLAKYDTDGNEVWVEQLGSEGNDQARSIAINEEGDVFIVGQTDGELVPGQQRGSADVFVAKYSTDGVPLWIKQLGSTAFDMAESIATDDRGSVFICGVTSGELELGNRKEAQDIFLAKFIDEMPAPRHQVLIENQVHQLSEKLTRLELAQLPMDLDLRLIQAANARTKGRGGARISEAEAREIVALAKVDKKKLSETRKKTLAFIYARYTLTRGAKEVILKAMV